MQKSKSGFVQAVLLDILKTNHDLIPVAFPDILQSGDFPEPTLTELSDAIRRLVLHKAEHPFKVCLFIDGLHEMDGRSRDSKDVIDLIRTLSSVSNIKVVLSSRRIPSILEPFSQAPGIRLEEHSHQDVQRFVTESLKKSGSIDFEMLQDIAKYLVQNTQGVFLWALLAVRSVRNGIQNADSLSDLFRRMQSLSSDMETLYQHLIQDVETSQQSTLSMMYQVMLRATELLQDSDISPRQLWATSSSEILTQALGMVRKPWPLLDHNHTIHQEGLHLLNYSNTTIQTTLRRKHDPSSAYADFIHPSFRQFLNYSEGRNWLIKNKDNLVVDTRFIGSCLSEIKLLPSQDDIILGQDQVLINAMNCLTVTRHAEGTCARTFTEVLDDLYKAVSAYWSEARRVKGHGHDAPWEPTAATEWSTFVTREQYPHSAWRTTSQVISEPFLTLAVVSGCVLYAADKVITGGTSGTLNYTDRTVLLAQMLEQLFKGPGDDTRRTIDRDTASKQCFNTATAIHLLLEHGAMPNVPISYRGAPEDSNRLPLTSRDEDKDFEMTAWSFFLTQLHSVCKDLSKDQEDTHLIREAEQVTHLLRIFGDLVLAGANVTGQPATCQVDAISVLNDLEDLVNGKEGPLRLYRYERDLLKEKLEKTRDLLTGRTAKHSLALALREVLVFMSSKCTSARGMFVFGWSLVVIFGILYMFALGT